MRPRLETEKLCTVIFFSCTLIVLRQSLFGCLVACEDFAAIKTGNYSKYLAVQVMLKAVLFQKQRRALYIKATVSDSDRSYQHRCAFATLALFLQSTSGRAGPQSTIGMYCDSVHFFINTDNLCTAYN
jgi:hypothetical protein